MTRISSLAVAAATAFALGACAGEGGQLATSPESPTFQTAAGTPACSLTDLRKAAEDFFGRNTAGAEKAKLFTNQNVNKAASLPIAFDLFAMVAAERDNGGWKTTLATDAAELTLEVIACSDVVYTDAALSGTANEGIAKAALEAALDVAGTGTYEVRGGETDATGAAIAGNKQAGLGNPTGGFASWLGSTANNSFIGRTLIIGRTIGTFATEVDGGFAYDWSLVRARTALALNGLATISYCTDSEVAVIDAFRIAHDPAVGDEHIIPYTTTDVSEVDCEEFPGTLGSRLLKQLRDLVVPAPLFAAVGKGGPVSGTIGSFSPTELVWPASINLDWVTQPTNAPAFTAIPVVVAVTGANGTPWKGVTIRLNAFANNGEPLALCGAEVETDAAGLATFTKFAVNKSGGLYLVATTIEPGNDVDVTTYAQASIGSDRFIVGPSKKKVCP